MLSDIFISPGVSGFERGLYFVWTMGTCPFDCTEPVSAFSFFSERFTTEGGLGLERTD